MDYDARNDYQTNSINYDSGNSVTIKYNSSVSCGRGCNPCVRCKF